MSLYEKLKQIQWFNYYILGEQNKPWKDTIRNPFTGIKRAIGVLNVDPHSIIDLRMFYIPYELIPRETKYKMVSMVEAKPYYILPSGVKKTLGESWVRWIIGKWVIFELRKSHPVDACYLNGGLTFSFNLVNKYFPWISLNIRWSHKHYLNLGCFWEGTNESDKKIAEFGMKARIANYDNEVEWNSDSVSPSFFEGHI